MFLPMPRAVILLSHCNKTPANGFSAPVLFTPTWKIQEKQSHDNFCSSLWKIKKAVRSNAKNQFLTFWERKCCTVRRIFQNNQPFVLLVMPKNLIITVSQEVHGSLTAGNLGVAKTFERMKNCYHFHESLAQVAKFVSTCESCQQRYSPKTNAHGYFQHLQVAGPFVRVHIDYTEPFSIRPVAVNILC